MGGEQSNRTLRLSNCAFDASPPFLATRWFLQKARFYSVSATSIYAAKSSISASMRSESSLLHSCIARCTE